MNYQAYTSTKTFPRPRRIRLELYAIAGIAIVGLQGKGSVLQDLDTYPSPATEQYSGNTVSPRKRKKDSGRVMPNSVPFSIKSETEIDFLFSGGFDSLVARTVGHAEGTRTAEGNKTSAWGGHIDPGNGVWNLGTFSFQHCREYGCRTGEEADVHQLKRLKGQFLSLKKRADVLGLELSLVEALNGIDLLNQAPLAGIGEPPAYPERLLEAKKKGLQGEQAILYARSMSFYSPNGKLQAGGLGNSFARVQQDQKRRMDCISRVLKVKGLL